MATLKVTLEPPGTLLETLETVPWVPRMDEFIVLNGTNYKVEKVEYHVTVVDGNPTPTNPRWVSEDYVTVFVSVVP